MWEVGQAQAKPTQSILVNKFTRFKKLTLHQYSSQLTVDGQL